MNTFKLEEYLTKYEFSSKYLLCCSDAETIKISELLAMANNEEQHIWENLTLQYTEPYGNPLLRNRISDGLYAGLKAENILCFAGAEEGIFAGLSAICSKSEHAIVLTPCYQSLIEIPRLQGSSITEIELEKDNWKIDLNKIQAAIQPNTKCIVMNFPHNPTGQIIEEKTLRELIKICKAHDVWLFSDEVYRLLGKPVLGWAAPAACLYEKALSLGVMSKLFGLPGLRIGWIACQNTEILHKMKITKDYLSICNSAPSEILSIIALNNKETILYRNNEIVSKNLQLLDVFFHEYQHLFEWIRPQGGCVGFVKYKGSESIDSFCNRLVKEKNVLLLPGSVYNYPGNYFRIGFGRQNMPECLERFQEFLGDY